MKTKTPKKQKELQKKPINSKPKKPKTRKTQKNTFNKKTRKTGKLEKQLLKPTKNEKKQT